MRTLDEGFAAHIATGATTLATCWRIVRRDGRVLGFTDHDERISFADTEFKPAHGLDSSERASKLGPQTDTSEVMGVLHAEAVTEDDILLGRYDGASVETWYVNWRDPAERHLLRRDTIGEITREDSLFRMELRSAQHAMNVPVGRIYQASCTTSLGDATCGINLEDPHYRGAAIVDEIRDSYRIAVGGLSGFESGWFAFGKAIWADGRRQDTVDRIAGHTRTAGVDVLSFKEPVGDWAAVGNALVVYAGCDRRLSTCRDKFANVINFRGFPHIPGPDVMLRYPREGMALDGRALVK